MLKAVPIQEKNNLAVPVVTAVLLSSAMLPLSTGLVEGTGMQLSVNAPATTAVPALAETRQSLDQEQSLQRLMNRQIREQAEKLRLEAEAKQQAEIKKSRWRAATLVRPKTPSRGDQITAPTASNSESLLEYALSLNGVPYLYGGTNPKTGLDCSAYTQLVFRKSGIDLPRTAYLQFLAGVGIPRSSLGAGDLVFFSTNGSGASHVGIYLGDGKFISATNKGVKVQNLNDDYWTKYYRGSRRVQPESR